MNQQKQLSLSRISTVNGTVEFVISLHDESLRSTGDIYTASNGIIIVSYICPEWIRNIKSLCCPGTVVKDDGLQVYVTEEEYDLICAAVDEFNAQSLEPEKPKRKMHTGMIRMSATARHNYVFLDDIPDALQRELDKSCEKPVFLCWMEDE